MRYDDMKDLEELLDLNLSSCERLLDGPVAKVGGLTPTLFISALVFHTRLSSRTSRWVTTSFGRSVGEE